MSILDKFTQIPTGRTTTNRVFTTLSVVATRDVDFATVYELHAQIVARFTCTDRHYIAARQKADRQILQYLYQEPLEKVNMAIDALYAGDEESVVRILLDMRREMTGCK